MYELNSDSMLKKDYLPDTLIRKRNEVMRYLESRFPYQEIIQDNRIVLLHKRIKLVQILATEEDFRQYDTLNMKYLNYVNTHYCPNLHMVDFDRRVEFLNTIASNSEKLPFFFVYNSKGEILGLCGFKTTKFFKDDNILANELSTRMITDVAQNSGIGYGAIAAFIAIFYAYSKHHEVYMSTAINNRDFVFHCTDKLGMRYIGVQKWKHDIFDTEMLADFFKSF